MRNAAGMGEPCPRVCHPRKPGAYTMNKEQKRTGPIGRGLRTGFPLCFAGGGHPNSSAPTNLNDT